jgi:hypothetical protein
VAGKDPHIKSQDSAYRRGLVLGLTMTEIMLLILFALLLALAAALANRQEIIKAKNKEIALLAPVKQQLEELFRTSPAGVTVEDILRRIERQQSQIAAQERELERLRPMEASKTVLDDIIREIKRADGTIPPSEQIVEQLKKAKKMADENAAQRKEIDRLGAFEASAKKLDEIGRELKAAGIEQATAKSILEMVQQAQRTGKESETLKGQMAQLTNKLNSLGRGNDFPTCWPTPEGKTESIFDLTISGAGIRIKDRQLSHRTQDKAQLPLSSVRYDVDLPGSTFLEQLRPLYQWSVEHRCRFHVIIRSSVANTPVTLVNAVNSYFYSDSMIRYRAPPNE